MTLSPISFNDNKSVYNAIKIKVDSPQTNIPEGHKNSDDNAEYNAVSLEIDKPAVNVYSYPECSGCVTADNMAGYLPMNNAFTKPSYQTNLINNRTFINAEFEVKEHKHNKPVDAVVVPEPNFTTAEDEKKDLTFHGLSFKAAPQVEVASDGNLKSMVDIDKVRDILRGDDFDAQAVELEKIASASLDKDYARALPYLTSEIFSVLDNIIEKDTSNLEMPNETQIEARKKIIINEIAKAQALSKNPNLKPDEIKLPYEITESDMAAATKLAPFEMAERNKEYGIYTLAGLIKVYSDEFEKNMGDVVPLTDLPCISSIVNTLKSSENPDLKIAAINALMVIQKPEYKDEIGVILNVASNDSNPDIAQYAKMASEALKK